MLLSLILPVYNVEAYLGKCIESCLHQDLPKSDYEIIVVIDGSPDHSIDIAKDYQKRYDNIKIVTRENGGLSAARNTGLMAASGDYVWFVDSDDYISENILKGIVLDLKNNQLDALWIGWDEVDDKGKPIPPFAPHCYRENEEAMTGKEFMANVLSNFLYAWSFIYKRSFLFDHHLLFTEGMYYEDTDFAFRSLPKVQRIIQYNKVCYHYLQRENSIVHLTNMKKLEGICQNCISANQALKECDKSLQRFYQICFTAFYMFFVKEVLKSKNKDYADYLIHQSVIHKFGKVFMYGNIKTKMIGLVYNLLGVRCCMKLLWGVG